MILSRIVPLAIVKVSSFKVKDIPHGWVGNLYQHGSQHPIAHG